MKIIAPKDGEGMAATPTPGQTFRSAHPDWPHECCYAGWCHYRSRHAGDCADGVTEFVHCESPAGPCDYYTGGIPDAEQTGMEGQKTRGKA